MQEGSQIDTEWGSDIEIYDWKRPRPKDIVFRFCEKENNSIRHKISLLQRLLLLDAWRLDEEFTNLRYGLPIFPSNER